MPTALPYHPALGQRLRALADPADRPCWLRLEDGRQELFALAPVAGVILSNQVLAGGPECDLSYKGSFSAFWEALPPLLCRFPPSGEAEGYRFRGGLLGFIGYGPSPAPGLPSFPTAWMGAYPRFIRIDHTRRKAEFEALPGYAELPTSWQRLLENVTAVTPAQGAKTPSFRLTAPFRPLTPLARYRESFTRIQAYLHSGDCYQVNYTQAFRASCEGSGAAAMDSLLATSNARHAAWLALPEGEVLSLSPELFLRVEGRRITTRPIKGTAPRADDPAADAVLRRELEGSAKNRAENLMIVDLLRHDVGRHADTGSVQVAKLFEVESLPQVHHLVSTVTARLRADAHVVDLVRDCFPGGSITGAPKKRAMEIIAELEDTPRSVYCGSIGYIGADGEVELNIAIRTLLRTGSDIYAWAGGGIVADSECEAEYAECFHKIGALLRTLEALDAEPTAQDTG